MTDGTKLNLNPGSHYMRRAVDTIEVGVPKWSILIFHQNLVHGGSAYEIANTRLHGYISNTPELIPDNLFSFHIFWRIQSNYKKNGETTSQLFRHIVN